MSDRSAGTHFRDTGWAMVSGLIGTQQSADCHAMLMTEVAAYDEPLLRVLSGRHEVHTRDDDGRITNPVIPGCTCGPASEWLVAIEHRNPVASRHPSRHTRSPNSWRVASPRGHPAVSRCVRRVRPQPYSRNRPRVGPCADRLTSAVPSPIHRQTATLSSTDSGHARCTGRRPGPARMHADAVCRSCRHRRVLERRHRAWQRDPASQRRNTQQPTLSLRTASRCVATSTDRDPADGPVSKKYTPPSAKADPRAHRKLALGYDQWPRSPSSPNAPTRTHPQRGQPGPLLPPDALRHLGGDALPTAASRGRYSG
jgi:hypothetical protein